MKCPSCGGQGAIPTGECRVAMSGPSCGNADCPPCQAPETDPCETCGSTGQIDDNQMELG